MCNIGRHRWSVARLVALVKGFDVMDIPLDHLSIMSSKARERY
jgi:hypothetical protein